MTRIFFSCIFDASQRVPFTESIKEGWDLLSWYKRNGYKIYILSNMDLDTMRLTKAKFPAFFALVDGIVYSGETHVMKPKPEIFQILLDQYGLKPEQCIFFDDQMENIKSAQKLGFEAVLSTRNSMKTSLEELKQHQQPEPNIALAVS